MRLFPSASRIVIIQQELGRLLYFRPLPNPTRRLGELESRTTHRGEPFSMSSLRNKTTDVRHWEMPSQNHTVPLAMPHIPHPPLLIYQPPQSAHILLPSQLWCLSFA